jgi:hypothetical protein
MRQSPNVAGYKSLLRGPTPSHDFREEEQPIHDRQRALVPRGRQPDRKHAEDHVGQDDQDDGQPQKCTREHGEAHRVHNSTHIDRSSYLCAFSSDASVRLLQVSRGSLHTRPFLASHN